MNKRAIEAQTISNAAPPCRALKNNIELEDVLTVPFAWVNISDICSIADAFSFKMPALTLAANVSVV
jgi:hypothetical protein